MLKKNKLVRVSIPLISIYFLIISHCKSFGDFEEEFIPYYQGICREHGSPLMTKGATHQRKATAVLSERIPFSNLRERFGAFVRRKVQETMSSVQQQTQKFMMPVGFSWPFRAVTKWAPVAAYQPPLLYALNARNQANPSSAPPAFPSPENPGGSPAAPNKPIDQNLQELRSMKVGIGSVDSVLESQEAGDEVNVLLGNTGSGKSTVFNYLCGVPLVAEVVEGTLVVDKRDKADREEETGRIEHRRRSGTTMPYVNRGYFDCPGFQDTRGAAQDIVNGYSVYKLFGRTKRVRLTLVVSEEELNVARGLAFMTLIKQTEEIFAGNADGIKQGLNVIVTKSNKGNIANFKGIMREIIDARKDHLTKFQREILGFLASEDNNQITFFKKPTKPGEIPLGVELIRKGPSIDASSLASHISVSDSTKVHVRDLADWLTRRASKFMAKLHNDRNAHTRALVRLHEGPARTLRDSFRTIADDLGDAEGRPIGTSSEDISRVERAVKKFAPAVALRFTTLMGHRKFLMHIKPEGVPVDLNLNADGRLAQVRNDLKPLSDEPTYSMDAGTVSFRGHIIGTSDFEGGATGASRLNIYARNSLLVDHDFTFPGGNMAVASPFWRVMGARTINLKGNPAGTIVPQQAAHGVIPGIPNIQASHGANGIPGLPGYNGGSFYGLVDEMDNSSALTVDVSGGNGGTGQMGGNGADGASGEHGVEEDVKGRKHTILKVKEDPVKRGSVMTWLRWAFVPNEELRETYRSGSPGIAGGNAGAGGVGGYGGQAGGVTLKSLRFSGSLYAIKMIGDMGPRGQNGPHGKPGKGGINGRVYEGIYIEKSFGMWSWVKKTTANGVTGAGMGAGIGAAVGAILGPGGAVAGAQLGAAVGGGTGAAAPTVGTAADKLFDEGWEKRPRMLPYVEHAADGAEPKEANLDGIQRPAPTPSIDENQFRQNWENESRSS